MINNLGTAVPPGRPGAPRVPRGRCRATPQPAQGGRRLPAARAGDRRSIGRGGAADLRRVPRRQRRPGDRERAQPRCDPLPVGAAARSEPAPPRRWLAGFDGPGDLGQPRYTGYAVFGRWRRQEVLADPDDVAAGHVTRFRRAGPEHVVRSREQAHPAIVSVETFTQTQLLRASRAAGGLEGRRKLEHGLGPAKHTYVLRGGSGARTARARWRARPSTAAATTGA